MAIDGAGAVDNVSHLYRMAAMYVCLCYEITETQVLDAISGGASTVNDLRRKLKVSNCCGACEPTVENCLQKALGPRPSDSPEHLQIDTR